MPAYIGGKSRISKDIYEVITKIVPNVKDFYDLMCGGLSISMEFTRTYNVYSNDYNEDLVFLWNYVRSNEIHLPIITLDKYKEYLMSNEMSYEKSFALIYCTYMCRYRGNFIENQYQRNGRTLYYHQERFNGIKKSQDKIKMIKNITCMDYRNFKDLSGVIVYFDPPYIDSFKWYKSGFDTDEFWRFVSHLAKKNYVFVSERSCPIPHEVVYEKEIINNVTKNPDKKLSEKLFFIRSS